MYERTVQNVFRTDRFGCSGDKSSSFVLLSGGAGERRGLWVVKELLLFRTSVRRSN